MSHEQGIAVMAGFAHEGFRLPIEELHHLLFKMDKKFGPLSGAAHGSPAHCSPSPLRIFIVEDSEAVRDLIIENLQDIPGVEIGGFSDTENGALQQLKADAYDVLILDIELRQGNGMSLLRNMAQASIQPDNFKIIFSNNVTDTYRRAGKGLGVRYFFDKTSEFLQLHGLLAKLAAGVPVA